MATSKFKIPWWTWVPAAWHVLIHLPKYWGCFMYGRHVWGPPFERRLDGLNYVFRECEKCSELADAEGRILWTCRQGPTGLKP